MKPKEITKKPKGHCENDLFGIKNLTGIGEITMSRKEQKKLIKGIIEKAINRGTKIDNFKIELESLINKHSIDALFNCQDFILVNYIMSCLEAYGDIEDHKNKMRGQL